MKLNRVNFTGLLRAIGCMFFTAYIVGLNGCASTKDIPIAAYTSPPNSVASKLYVYRDVSMPTRANVEIQVDGRLMAILPTHRFTWINVPPGKHVIAVGYPSFPDMRARLEIEFTEGETYLIQYDSKFGNEKSLFGIHPPPVPGVTNDGQGGYTRIRLFPSSDIPRIVEQYPYVVGQP